MPASAKGRRCRDLIVLLFCIGVSQLALAHKPSDSYLNLDANGEHIAVQWDIALRDLEHAVGIDGNRDGAITWSELQSRHEGIAAYALSRLQVSANQQGCDFGATELKVSQHSDGAYAVLLFQAKCAQAPEQLGVGYNLLFSLDPLHRGLLRLTRNGQTHSAVFSPEQPSHTFAIADRPALWQTARQYFELGVWHIWVGVDHLLFLAGLLLPVVLRRKAGEWVPVKDMRTALVSAVALVTSFTLAHTITLILGALDLINAPSRWVESAIAATLVFTALNNFLPLVKPGKLWMLAFGFGLIHGLGFASVLAGLGLPSDARALALLAFNLGVEAGQLAVLSLFLPFVFGMRRLRPYQAFVLPAGSIAIAIVGALWLVERSLDINWSPL